MNRFFSILLLLLISNSAFAGLFDDRFPSPRHLAMGSSGVAMNSGVWGAYYNPASFSQMENIAIGSSYIRPFSLNFFSNIFGAGTYPLPKKYGTFALTFEYFGVNYESESLSGEYTVGISHGFNLLKDINSSLSFGYSVKMYHLELGTSVENVELGSSSTLGLDIGFQASVYSRTTAGVYVLNVNSPKIGDVQLSDLPQRIVAGIAYTPYDGVTTSIDLNRSINANATEVWAGAEFQVVEMILLRFGGTTNPNRFTAGVGINIEKIQLDYALRTHSDLGETHAFGFSYAF